MLGAGHGIRGARGRAWPPRRRLSLALPLVAALAACDLPKDPEGTLERARGATLRVGVVESPPWIVRSGDGATGPEADLVRAFAKYLEAEVDWRWGAVDAHLAALERFELDVVAAGLTHASPWRSRVGFTRPWRTVGGTRHVLAVPPGENRTLVALERLVERRKAGAR